MTKDEALKLALEALKQIDEAMPFPVAKLAQAAIKEALAQPEQDWKIHPKEDAPLVKWAKEQTPPQRTWVGLTDEEWNAIYYKFAEHGASVSGWDFAKAIEAKLKEKNT